MSRTQNGVSSMWRAVALFLPVVFSGFAIRASYLSYDPAYEEDYPVWDSGEGVYYQRWEVETHRDHRDFHNGNFDKQEEYWT